MQYRYIILTCDQSTKSHPSTVGGGGLVGKKFPHTHTRTASRMREARLKIGVLYFGVNNSRNGASYALDDYGSLIGNHIQRIEWYYLRPTIRQPEVPEIAYGT